MLVTCLEFTAGPVYTWTCARCGRQYAAQTLPRLSHLERRHEARFHRWANSLDPAWAQRPNAGRGLSH